MQLVVLQGLLLRWLLRGHALHVLLEASGCHAWVASSPLLHAYSAQLHARDGPIVTTERVENKPGSQLVAVNALQMPARPPDGPIVVVDPVLAECVAA